MMLFHELSTLLKNTEILGLGIFDYLAICLLKESLK